MRQNRDCRDGTRPPEVCLHSLGSQRGWCDPEWAQGAAGPQRWPPPGFHLNNQLTQALTSRYRDSRLRVDFERFVSCMAQLICVFRECPPRRRWGKRRWSPRLRDQGGGPSPHPSLHRPLQPAPGWGRGGRLPDPQTGEPGMQGVGGGVPGAP